MTLTTDQLKSISNQVLGSMRSLPSASLAGMLRMKDYHGFGNSEFPDYFIEPIIRPFNAVLKEVEIRLIHVSTDLSKEIHLHKAATAYITVLGPKTHLPGPVHAFAYLKGKWFPVSEDDTLEIPQCTPHGFTIRGNGDLYFLSVQSPPLIDEEGNDDYHLVDMMDIVLDDE